MPTFHRTLRQRRLDVGMGEGRASQLLGLTIMGYYDLEAYADEWRTVVPLYITIFACKLFEIDMLQFVPDQTGTAVGPNVLGGDVIKERREAMGLDGSRPILLKGHESVVGPIENLLQRLRALSRQAK